MHNIHQLFTKSCN